MGECLIEGVIEQAWCQDGGMYIEQVPFCEWGVKPPSHSLLPSHVARDRACLIVTPPNRKLSRKLITGLRSRRLEVVGETENGRAWGGRACLLLARPFFLVPTNSKRLLRRLANNDITTILGLSSVEFENGEALNSISLAVRISMTIAL